MALSNPVVNFEIIPAFQKQQNEAQKVLFIGQMVAGTATPGVVEENIGNANEQDALFGAESMVATMVRAFKRVNLINRVDVLPLADGTASVAATGNVTFLTPATANGTIIVSIGSKLHNSYQVDITSGDSIIAIGDALDALIAADPASLVTTSNVGGVVTLTALNKGVTGNTITVEVAGTVGGVTYTSTNMSGGTGEPDSITDGTAFNAINADTRYQGILYPKSYNRSGDYIFLRTFLDARFNASNRILDGQAFIGITDTLSNIDTLATAVDNNSISLLANQPVSATTFKGSSLFEMDYVVATYLAAIRALRLTPNAQISQYIEGASGALDDLGGVALASLPYMNTPFTDLLPVIDPIYFWSDEDVNELLGKGVSVIGNNVGNTNIIAGQMVTTYLTDAAANQDITYKYLNFFDTFTNIREYFVNNLKARFVQSRLVDGDITPLRNEANAQTIIAVLLGLYQDLEVLMLAEKGPGARKFFKNHLVVSIDKTDGSVDISMELSPVVQLRTINTTMQIVFNINL